MCAQQKDSWWMGKQPSGGLLQGLATVPMSLFVKILLPLTIVFLLAFVLQYRAEVGADRARVVTQEASVLDRGVRRVDREFDIATGDLFFVADLATDVIDGGTPESLAALRRSLLAFVRNRPGYAQVQVIGTTGRELLSIKNASAGPQVTPQSQLRDQRKRAYFTSAMRIERGKVSSSPTESPVERATGQEPNEPAIRLATPIDDAQGLRLGIVTLAVRGGYVLRAFEQTTNDAGVQRMVVNSDGFWLRERPDAEEGFALERGRSFQRSFPDVWPQLLTSPRGRVESSEGFFFFDTPAPNPLAAGGRIETDGAPVWVFISLVPRALLDDMGVQVATPLLMVATPAYFVVLVAGCLLASALQRRRLTDLALRNLEEVKAAMMTAALDGIVVMDENGTTLEFNRSAQRIFGYSLEEARGRLVADLIIPPAYRERHRLGLEHYLDTGEGRIIDKHVDEMTGIRKNGEEFPVELTVCPVMIAGKQFFYGFLRDLSEAGRREVQAAADPVQASTASRA